MADISASLTRIKDALKSALSITDIVQGSKIHAIAESIANESASLEDEIIAYAAKNSIISATGSDLEALAEYPFGIKRIKPTIAKVTSSSKALKFYTNNKIPFGEINKNSAGLPQDILVPEGIIISGDSGNTRYSFRITKDVTLKASSTEAYIDAELINGDYRLIAANSLRQHNFTGYTLNSTSTLLVTNPVAIGTASEEESDDNLRYRLITALQSKVDSAYYGIKNNLLVLPGVSNVEVFPGVSGGGSFVVVIQGTTPITSDEVIESAKLFLSQTVPDWVSYEVVKPNYVGIVATINIEAGTSIIDQSTLSQMEESVKSYINNFYGTAFKPLYLQNIITSMSSKVYSATLFELKLYTGTDEFRMYEQFSLTDQDPFISLSPLDKLIVETNIDNPIIVTQVQ